MKKLLLSALMSVLALGVYAADNLLAGKPVYLLGEAKTWAKADGTTYTMNVDDLKKVTNDPANTANIYLFPEGGYETDDNKAVGIQAFYVDMQASCKIESVYTTWEGAAADSYMIYVTDETPAISILDTDPVYSVSGLGQFTENTAKFTAEGRYLVFVPTNATNYGWGVKIRSIQATGFDPTPKINLAAEVSNVTAHTADITYSLDLTNITEDKVKVYLGEQVISSPYTLTDLNHVTEYNYTLKAVAEYEGQEIESNEAKVTFTTLRDETQGLVWNGLADGMINNAYYEGEDESMRRSLPVSIEVVAVYNTDKTMTFTATLKSAKAIAGVNGMQIVAVSDPRGDNQPDHAAMTPAENGSYTFTTEGTYEDGARMAWFNFAPTFEGGVFDAVSFPGALYFVGNTQAPVTVGEPTSLELAVGRINRVGQSMAVSAVAKDAAGHYVFDTPVEMTVDNDNFSVEGFVLTANERGTATLTARSGNLTKTAGLICAMTSEAIKLERANAYASSAMDDISKCFDGNEGTEGIWNCAETEEHWLVFELDGIHDIQGVELIWEGAMAQEYTLTLSQQPVINAPAARAQANGAEPSNHVFTVTDGANSADATYRMHTLASGYNAKYITLQTQKAVNVGWGGIKLKEMNVYGALEPSGVADVAVEAEGAVEYYNLQGVRIEGELAPGLYIRRQGNTASKILVK